MDRYFCVVKEGLGSQGQLKVFLEEFEALDHLLMGTEMSGVWTRRGTPAGYSFPYTASASVTQKGAVRRSRCHRFILESQQTRSEVLGYCGGVGGYTH